MNKLLLLTLLILAVPFVLASQPTQQFNKLYLNPFYRESMALNTNYTYTVSINPPDAISSVVSAIVSFNAQINGQSQNFSIWVNGQPCSTSSYYVATAYSTTGNVQFSFDCSNRITQAGTYNITLRSAVNTGAVSGWIDLTYMNNPFGTLDIHGTEYVPGDSGRMFLQFLDANKLPITNSACTLSLWYPNNTKFVNNSAMTYLDEGIYYYNFIVPSTTGVYPASAKCFVPYTFGNITVQNNVTESWDSNSFTGGTGWGFSNATNATNGWDYYSVTVVTNATAGTGGCQDGPYCAQIAGISQSAQYLERGFITPANAYSMTITFWLKSTLGTSDTASYDVFNGNWHQMEVYRGSDFTPNVWYKKNYTLTTAAGYYLDSTAILQGFFAISWTAANKYLYMDNFSVSYLIYNTTISNVSAYQVLMGSGEAHVSNLYSSLNASFNGTSPAAIWSYPNRTLTTVENYTAEAQAVWNYTTRNLTYYPPDFTPAEVWNYTTRNLTYYPPDFTPADVWNYTTRNLTYYQNFSTAQTDLTNYSRINQSIQDAMSTTNALVLAVNQSLYNTTMSTWLNTSSNIQLVPYYTWSYSVRNLTTYYDMTNYTFLTQSVWNDTARYVHGVLI